jgi:hypothetical protein
MPPQIIPGINPALMPIIPVKADRVPPHWRHRLRPRRSLIHRQQRLRFRLRHTRPASRFLPLIMARRARTSIAQPRKCPVATVPVFPIDLHAAAACLVDTHLRRSLRVHRQLALRRPRLARFFLGNEANSLVTHLFQSIAPKERNPSSASRRNKPTSPAQCKPPSSASLPG